MPLDGALQDLQALGGTLTVARIAEQCCCHLQVIGRQHAIAKFVHRHGEECPGGPGMKPDADDPEPSRGLDPHCRGQLSSNLSLRLAFHGIERVPVNRVAGVEQQLDTAIGKDRVGARGRIEPVTFQAPDALHEARGDSAHSMLRVFHDAAARPAMRSSPSAKRRR